MDIAEDALRLATAADILARVLVDPFTTNLPQIFADPALLESWPLDDSASTRGIDTLSQALTSPDGLGSLELIKRDHLYLFGGAGKPLACPYESPYVDKDGLVFDEATFAVRAAYKRFGFQINNLNREPDDHLGYELAFVSALCKHLSQYPQDSDVKKQLDDFVTTHLSAFGYAVAEGIAVHARSPFYLGSAHLLTGLLDKLRDFTNVEISVIGQ
ncbi:MAG: molecular chaperone TorD family protein [Actinomycetaceae bacterium]|nr:molecular chaperone TorD family protein [Actinomycetaceae bacterium]